MMLCKWEKLPSEMQCSEVREYYDILKSKQCSLFFKRLFDIIVSLMLLIILSPVFLVLAIAIKIDSKGPVFYRQERVTQYGKHFRIFKFRSMVNGADKKGTAVTVSNDLRITKVGKFIRKYRLDEISQLIDVLRGTMSFVGTRPEVPKYVEHYTPEMTATLLLPAGVTSLASIYYKDEADLLNAADNPDRTYIDEVLPGKMKYNLKEIREYGFWKQIIVMVRTIVVVISGNRYSENTAGERKDNKQLTN